MNPSALLLGCLLCAMPSLAAPAAASEPTTLSALIEQSGFLYAFLVALLTAGYQRAPALVLVLCVLLVVPAVAILSLFLQSGLRALARRREVRAMQRSVDDASNRDSGADAALHGWPGEAWISVEGATSPALPLAAPMVCIGRHADNDIRLPDQSVHRYHAVIHRTPDADFFITDLSGEDGNGVRINGRRQVQARLADGDRIEIGKARLTFAAISA